MDTVDRMILLEEKLKQMESLAKIWKRKFEAAKVEIRDLKKMVGYLEDTADRLQDNEWKPILVSPPEGSVIRVAILGEASRVVYFKRGRFYKNPEMSQRGQELRRIHPLVTHWKMA